MFLWLTLICGIIGLITLVEWYKTKKLPNGVVGLTPFLWLLAAGIFGYLHYLQ